MEIKAWGRCLSVSSRYSANRQLCDPRGVNFESELYALIKGAGNAFSALTASLGARVYVVDSY